MQYNMCRKMHPNIQWIIPDLPGHHNSRSAYEEDKKYTMDDVSTSIEAMLMGIQGSKPSVDFICGHSFGGKVATRFAYQLNRKYGHIPKQIWVIDTFPARIQAYDPIFFPKGFLDNSVPQMIDYYNTTKAPYESPKKVANDLKQLGFKKDTIDYITKFNLEKTQTGQYDWNFIPHALEELFSDYMCKDMFEFLEDPIAPLKFIRASKNARWTPDLIDRLSHSSRVSKGKTQIDIIESEHSIHVEKPKILLELLDTYIKQSSL
eukprot:TRINITY_DN3492_c1_g1_i2.p1 TRINITY_DN3492_c1_g1~~TRINITY_DN3492_c1_g1_i2.p1  ORF type:complete len:262 (-),score=45.72 TRINITY_DN3492_c1_g1_i2:2-787(-)